jgi:competence protein ComEC
MVGLILASLLAGTATIPYTAYHFHRISPYGVIANLGAMPIVSAWVMPWGIVGLLAMPLGLDGPCWSFMGLARISHTDFAQSSSLCEVAF